MRIGKERVLANAQVPATNVSRAAPHDAISISAESLQINFAVTMSTSVDKIEDVLVDHPHGEVDLVLTKVFERLQGVFHARDNNDRRNVVKIFKMLSRINRQKMSTRFSRFRPIFGKNKISGGWSCRQGW